jgi:type II restriction enzyme
MSEAVKSNRTPDLFVMHYDNEKWSVSSVILIPHFAFSISSIEKRKPLGAKARRAGWVGCNILLGKIPSDARIPIVTEGRGTNISEVRQRYARLRPLEKLTCETRGWTLDVLNAVREIGKNDFSLSDVYVLETSLSRLYPRNRHIRDKIRQQLQVLRDLGLLTFLGHGRYRLRQGN